MLYKLTGSKSSRANEPISSIDRFNSSCRAGGIILQKKTDYLSQQKNKWLLFEFLKTSKHLKFIIV